MTRLIKLSGKHAVGDHQFALVDDDMFDELNKYAWKAKPNGGANNVYAIRTTKVNGKTRDVRMHRVVLGYDGPLDIDHINHNSLDNRRANLRVATRSTNMRNAKLVAYRATCRQCGESFNAKRKKMARERAFCSNECATEANRIRKFAASSELRSSLLLSCHQCGDLFQPSRSDQSFCSERCRKSAKWERQRASGTLPPSSLANAEYSRARRAAIKAGTWPQPGK